MRILVYTSLNIVGLFPSYRCLEVKLLGQARYMCILKYLICIAKLPSRKVEPIYIHSRCVWENWCSEGGITFSPVSKVWSTLRIEDSVTRMDGSPQTKGYLRMVWQKPSLPCPAQEYEIEHEKKFETRILCLDSSNVRA